MIDFNFEQFRESEPFVPAGAPKPDWHGKTATKAKLPPRWWSVPRDPTDGSFPMAQVPGANNRLSRWTVGLFLALGCAAFYLASRG